VDKSKRKQGPWWFRYEEVRGEPGFEEEGYFYNDKKQGPWKKFSLMGDLIAREYFIAGHRDGQQLYYNNMGDLIREESWKAIDPAHPFDTIMVPDVDHPESMIKKIIKHESAEIKHGVWKYYDPVMGSVTRTETFVYGQPPQVVSPTKNNTPVKTDVKSTPSVSPPIPGTKKSVQTQKKGKN
jgi:antitoxin component YwqK of YwqJK toxin-antitoxin module